MIRITEILLCALILVSSLTAQPSVVPAQNLDRDTLRVGDTLEWTFKVERVLRFMAGMEVRESKYVLTITDVVSDSLVRGRFVESHDKKLDKELWAYLKSKSNEAGGSAQQPFNYTPNPFEHGAASVVLHAVTGRLIGSEPDSVIPYYRVMYKGREEQPTKEQFLQFTASNLERFWIQVRPEVPDSVIRTRDNRVEFRKTSESTTTSISTNADGSPGKEVTQTSTSTTTDLWEIERDADTLRAISAYTWTVTSKIGERSISTRRKMEYDNRWHASYPVTQEFVTEGFGDPGSTRITITQHPWRRKK